MCEERSRKASWNPKALLHAKNARGEIQLKLTAAVNLLRRLVVSVKNDTFLRLLLFLSTHHNLAPMFSFLQCLGSQGPSDFLSGAG